jgi:putative pyruvate formate lyase activating enzyme
MRRRVDAVRALAAPCRLCPRRCEVDRRAGEAGFCGTGFLPVVSSASPHFGEEPPLVGRGGSGTIFLTGCNLGCVFCQNYDISHLRAGREITPQEVGQMMLTLERFGCHNVNFVTPTHQAHAVMEAIRSAREAGLSVPVVYNCSGYESLEVLGHLEGFVQIYMPDAKFSRPDSADRYCAAPDYPERMREALREMHRQVGDLVVRDGVAVSGLLVRHLLMPGGAEEGKDIIDFLCGLSGDTYVNVMAQYRPCFKAHTVPGIDRYPTEEEFFTVREYARSRGLRLAR